MNKYCLCWAMLSMVCSIFAALTITEIIRPLNTTELTFTILVLCAGACVEFAIVSKRMIDEDGDQEES